MTPLSRRDRAALVLAYELIRTRWALDAEDELRAVVDVLQAAAMFSAPPMADFARLVNDERFATYLTGDQPNRLLRARLALLLRAILRADAGKFGKMVCTCFGEPRDIETHRDARHCTKPHLLRYTPLWERARGAEGRR